MAERAPLTILLTGFGPFPGGEVNASAELVRRLAGAMRRRFADCRVATAVLPTEWEKAPARLAELFARHEPDIVLHFGVSDRAEGFEIETRARNACVLLPDAVGAMPLSGKIDERGPQFHRATVPAKAIVRRLQALGIPAAVSDDAGAYLCNSVLYRSVALGRAAGCISGFVHIPTGLAGAGPQRREPKPGCPMDWASALRGGVGIVAVCVAGA